MLVHIASDDSWSSLSTFTSDQIQPNAIDLRLDKVFMIDPDNDHFSLSEDGKKHRNKIELSTNIDGWFNLKQGHSYEVTFEGIVTIGPDEAGFVITRSTLNRNGVFITSGLYDSGYSGAMAGALHNLGGPTSIKKGTRVGQFLVWKAQALHAYNGSYGFNADGTAKNEEKRYHA